MSEINQHLLREYRRLVGAPGPVTAAGRVEKDEEGMIKDPRASGRVGRGVTLMMGVPVP